MLPMKRYEVLAKEIEGSIHAGVLRNGDRLPSVRSTSTSRGLSASTVFQAYYLLEARGIIRARQRSGYFVNWSSRKAPPTVDAPSQPANTPVSVDVCARVFAILESTRSRNVVPFGSAFPSPLLFPLARLGRSMAQSAKNFEPWDTVDYLTPGSPDLRRQIALRYLADGMQVHMDEIVITNGALEALNLCLQAVARPGDAVIVECPTFYGALQALENQGLRAIQVPTCPKGGIDLPSLEQTIQLHKPAACWLMPNFQNPLGTLMAEEKKMALIELLTRHDVPLIEDDVYAELYFGDRRPLPAKAYDTAGIVMHCSSFSKCLAPGYRIGWTAPGRYARQVAQKKLITTLTTSAPAQGGLANYLEQGGYDKHLRKLRQTLAEQQRIFSQAVGHYFPSGTRATRPEGGYFLWVELPEGVDAMHVHERALAMDISVAPGPIFSASHAFKNCIRLNFGHAWNDASERAMATLGKIVASCAPIAI
jgi:DNA-binding transcriptional MocR family regulator